MGVADLNSHDNKVCIAAAISGGAGWFCIYPTEVLRVRIIAANSTNSSVRHNYREIMNSQGIKGFFRGCHIAVFRGTLLGLIGMPIYDFWLRHLKGKF